MSYSVVIPSRNIANLTACVGTLREMGETARVIVVSDGVRGTMDDGIRFAEKYAPLEAEYGEEPFIFARNINIGINAAGRDDVVLLNDDALLRTRHGFAELSRWSAGFGAICPGFTHGSVGTANLVNRGKGELREEKVMLVFACVYIPRCTIDHVGLLDERFGVNAGGTGVRGYGLEDDDYSLRIHQAGLKLGVYDGVLVDHVPRSTGLKSTFRHDPEHPHSVRAHEDLFLEKWGHWPAGHGYAPGKSRKP